MKMLLNLLSNEDMCLARGWVPAEGGADWLEGHRKTKQSPTFLVCMLLACYDTQGCIWDLFL
jgi:hypothetical protein